MGKKYSREEIDAEMKRRGMMEHTPAEKRAMEKKKEMMVTPDQTKTTDMGPDQDAQKAIYTNYEDKPYKTNPKLGSFEANRQEYLKAEERRQKKNK